jgi:hypothetical protein
MAVRTVILDDHGQTLEVSVPAVEILLRDGVVAHAISHYGGDLENANVYRVTREYAEVHGDRAAIHRIEVLCGADALSEVQRVTLGTSTNGHRLPSESETREVYCERCGLHVSEWAEKKCTGQRGNVRVLVRR